jgi:hypothetical protein
MVAAMMLLQCGFLSWAAWLAESFEALHSLSRHMTLYSQVSAFRARCSPVHSHSPVRRLCRPTMAKEKMIEGDDGRADIAGRLDMNLQS